MTRSVHALSSSVAGPMVTVSVASVAALTAALLSIPTAPSPLLAAPPPGPASPAGNAAPVVPAAAAKTAPAVLDVRSVDLGVPATVLASNPAGTRLHVLHGTEPRLLTLTVAKPDAPVVTNLPAPGAAVCESGGRVWIAERTGGTLRCLDAETLKPVAAVELASAELLDVVACPAADRACVLVLGRAGATAAAGAILFRVDAADPRPAKGLRLTDEPGDWRFTATTDGRLAHVWRTDLRPGGVQVFDLEARRRIHHDPQLAGPVSLDEPGTTAATGSGALYSADFATRLSGGTAGLPAAGGTAGSAAGLVAVTVEVDAGAASEAGLREAVVASAVRLRFGAAGERSVVRPLPAPTTVLRPVQAGAGRVAWLSPRGGATDGSEAAPPMVLQLASTGGGDAAAAEVFRLRTRPPSQATAGRTLQFDLRGLLSPEPAAITCRKLAGPAGLTVSPDGAVRFAAMSGDLGAHDVRIAVTSGARSATVAWRLVVEPVSTSLAAGLERVDAERPFTLATDHASGDVLALNPATGRLSLLDGAEGTVLRRAAAGQGVVGPVLLRGKDGTVAPAVLDTASPAVVILAAGTLEPARRIALPGRPAVGDAATECSIATADSVPDAVWVGLREGRMTRVLRVDTAAGNAVEIARTPLAGHVFVSPDGLRVLVATGGGLGGSQAVVLDTDPDEPAGAAAARRGTMRLAGPPVFEPVTGRLFAGAEVWEPVLARVEGTLPAGLSAPHPRLAIAAIVQTPADDGVRVIRSPAALRPVAAEAYDTVADGLRGGDPVEVILAETNGFQPVARFRVPVPARPDGMSWDAEGGALWLRCGASLLRLPVDAGALAAHTHFRLSAPSAPTRVAAGAEVRVATSLHVSAKPGTPAPAARYRLVAAPKGLTLDEAAGTVTWTPEPSQTGVHTVLIEARAGDRAAMLRWSPTVEPGILRIPAGPFDGAALTADGTRLLLWKVGGTRLVIVPPGARPDAVVELDIGTPIADVFAVDARVLVCPAEADVLRIVDPVKGEVTGSVTLPARPVQVLGRPGTAELFVVDAGESVRRLDEVTLADRGIVARGRAAAFDPSGTRLHTLVSTAKAGLAVPDAGGRTSGGGVIVISGPGREEGAPGNPGAGGGMAIRIVTPDGEAGSLSGGGSKAWLTWTLVADRKPEAARAIPGSGAVKSGSPAAAALPKPGTVWGGPDSPWRLLDAVAAEEPPEGFTTGPGGATLLSIAEGRLRIASAGDPATVLAGVPLTAGAVADAVGAAGGAGAAAGARSATPVRVALEGDGTGRAWVLVGAGVWTVGTRNGAPTLLPVFRPPTPVTEGADPRTGAPRAGAEPTGTLLAVSAGGQAVLLAGRSAWRLPPVAEAVAARAGAEGLLNLPPSDFAAGEVIRWRPEVAGAAPGTLRLLSGPAGAVWKAATGELVWDAPASGGADVHRFVLGWTDAAGRAGRAAFVVVRAPAGDAPAAGAGGGATTLKIDGGK